MQRNLTFGQLPEYWRDTMIETVTVQGFAWNSNTRTYSDKITYEARNCVDAQNWIDRKSMQLDNLIILQDNTKFLMQQMIAAGSTQ